MDESLNTSLGSYIRTVGWKRLGQYAARESNDASAFRDMLCRLPKHEKRAAQVGGDHFVERLDIAVGDVPERHDARTVHYHVDLAEGVECIPEKALYLTWVRDISLQGDGLPTNRLNLVHDSLSFAGAAGIVHDHGKAVACKPNSHGAPEAARG